MSVSFYKCLYKNIREDFEAIYCAINFKIKGVSSEAVARKSSVKNLFLEISQNSQGNTCAGDFFNKVAGLSPETLFKKSIWHRCFAVNFTKFVRTLILTEHLRCLLLPFFSNFSL